MTGPASDAQIAAAETYERLFVPAEFQQWAARLLDAAHVQPGHRVLDVACGTGVLAREAARRVGLAGFVAGIDPDPGMLTVAAREAPSIAWRQGDAQALPYEASSFDRVVSQFGLMYFPDRGLALREMQRVLRPGGQLAVAVWDSLARTPAYADLVALFDRGGLHAVADAIRRPFTLGDTAALATLFSSAGLPDVTITTHVGMGRFADARSMVEAELEGWLPVVGITLSTADVDRVVQQARDVLRPYTTNDGHIQFAAPAHIVSGRIG